jgi:glutathione peroxidase-family protein
MKNKILLIFNFLFLTIISGDYTEMNVYENKTALYDFKINHATGIQIDLEQFKGKPILVVNVASRCGFTSQYKALQDIHEKYSPQGLVVIGIPTNDFGNQEPGTNAEILTFCSKAFGVTFTITEKVNAKKNIHPIFEYLTTSNEKFAGRITWNFNKFLLDKNGKVVNRFGSFTKPNSKKMIQAIEYLLAQP